MKIVSSARGYAIKRAFDTTSIHASFFARKWRFISIYHAFLPYVEQVKLDAFKVQSNATVSFTESLFSVKSMFVHQIFFC